LNPEDEIKKIVHQVEETAEKAVETTIKTVKKVESTFVKWLKRLGKVKVTILGILLLLIGLLQLSVVQTYLGKQATDYLTELTGFETSIEQVSIRWLDEAVLKKVVIKDRFKNKMIEVDELVVDYSITGLFDKKDITIDQVGLSDARVHLINNGKGAILNIQEWIASFLPSTPTTTTKSNSQFIIHEAYLQNAHFSYQDIHADSLEKGSFDYAHFELDSINAEIEKFTAKNDTITVNINAMSAINPAIRFPIHALRALFMYCNKSMNFQKLYASVGSSVLRDSLVFRYNNPADFADFNNKISIHAKLKDSQITFQDLALFAPNLKQWKETLKISGNINGKVTDLKIRKLDLQLGQATRFKGNIAMEGLPNIEETFIDYDLDNSQIFLPDIRQYLPEDAYTRGAKFGLVKFSSELQGFYYDFVAHGDFATDLGNFTADNIHLNLGENTNTYEGNLTTKAFDIGELLFMPTILQKVDLKGFIKGKGFTPATAQININSYIDRLGIMGYDYKKIDLDATLSKSLFEGKIVVNDSNFVFSADADINLKDSTIAFTGKIEKALLHKMNLTQKRTSVKAEMLLNLKGLSLDALEGVARINHFDFVMDGRRLDMDYFTLVDKVIAKDLRHVALVSSLVNFTAQGDFSVGTSVNQLSELAQEYLLHFERDSTKVSAYYAKKAGNNVAEQIVKKTKKQLQTLKPFGPIKSSNLNYEVWLKNVNPIFNFFQINAKLNQDIKINGEIFYGEKSGITLKTKIDSLFYDKLEFYDNNLIFNTSKRQDIEGVVGEVHLSSEKQFVLDEKNELIIDTDGLKIDANLTEFVLKYNLFVHQAETTNSVDTKGNLTFLPKQAFLLDIEPSKFNLVGEFWSNPEDTQIRIQGKEINFKNLNLSNGEDSISIVGDVSEDENKRLTVSIKDLELDVFSEFLGFKLGGKLNGFVALQGLYQQDKLKIENEIRIKEVSLNNFLVGNIFNSGTWDTPNKSMIINTNIERENVKTLICKGTYTPENKINPLDLRAQLADIEIRILEPFLADIASDFAGTAKGDLHITGAPAAPVVEGSAFVKKGKFTLKALGATYNFTDRIYFEKNSIAFKRFKIRDNQRSLGFLYGNIFHQGFQNFTLDLRANFKNFILLDTKVSDEALYYGMAVGTGTLGIKSEGNNLNIDVNVKSDKGTKMYLAFDGYSTVEKKDFINYVEFSPKRYRDTLKLDYKPAHPKIDLSRLIINLNTEITPDAFVEIILDRKTGDIIRGNATGKVSIRYDSKADMEMFGNVEIVNGAYNFTFQNLFNKEFGIARGSSISWAGDPLKGTMNIKATYLQRASLAPIIETAGDNESPEIKRRYPIQVDLLLKGELFSPEIKFDINFFDYPNTIVAGGQSISLANNVAAFKTRINNDEAELNRQVFSLILLRKLSPRNAFSGLGQSAAGSVSELLTNQLSYYLSQVDENLEVDIDLNGLDANALNTFQLRLSYSFLNGRVRVTRDGSFTNMQNQVSASSVIGDWTLEYLVTRDGKLRMKMYRRNFSNVFDASLGNTSATTGLSIMYFKSFNKFWDFFGNIFKKSKKKKEKEKAKEKIVEQKQPQ
jgi:hypothetical protein